MSEPAERKFHLPCRRGGPWWLWAIAAAVHVPVALLLVSSRNAPSLGPGSLTAIALDDTVPTVTLPYRNGRRTGLASPRFRAVPIVPVVVPRADRMAPLVATLAQVMPSAAVDTPPRRGDLTIRPRYGDGRLWVQPLPESPRKIASALTGQSPAEMADSAVTRMIQTYLDQMAKERAESPSALPSWTARIGGKTVGVDQKWIYLGPLKIPTALLALLPIKVQGNMSNFQFNQQLQLMRADLVEAARRSETYDEFKEAVKDLHQQKERERQFKRNQRTRPDTSGHG